MPHYHKIITLLFLISFGFFLTFNIVLAQQVEVNLQVPIYGQDVVRSSDPNNPAGLLSAYIALIYTYALGIASTLAVVMIMVGGFIWLTSAGSPDRVGLAKDFITSAITGLIIALFSYIILQTINPNLVTNQAPNLTTGNTVGCCTFSGVAGCITYTQEQCKSVAESVGDEYSFSPGQVCDYNIEQCVAPQDSTFQSPGPTGPIHL